MIDKPLLVSNFEWRAGGLVRLPPTTDLGASSVALPEGAYTTLRTYHGRRVVRLAEHVERLARSTGARLETAAVREAVRSALAAAGHDESRLRLTFAPPRLFVSVEPFVPLPRETYAEGVRCATIPLRRERPQAKDTRFLATAASAYRSLPIGVHEGLLMADDGAILEGLSSNFFAVLGGALRTEDARALHGITRSLVLEAAEGLLPLKQAAVTAAELGQVEECFLTSASRGILPVVAIDEAAIGDERPGPLTRELARRFDAKVEAEAEEA